MDTSTKPLRSVEEVFLAGKREMHNFLRKVLLVHGHE
jgi:hypothetical protein